MGETPKGFGENETILFASSAERQRFSPPSEFTFTALRPP